MSFKRMPIEHDDWKIVFFFLENSWEITEPLKIFFFLFIEILNKRNTCSNIKKNRNNEWTYTHTHAHWRWYKIRFHFDLKKYVKGKQNPSSLFLNNKKICVYWRFFFLLLLHLTHKFTPYTNSNGWYYRMDIQSHNAPYSNRKIYKKRYVRQIRYARPDTLQLLRVSMHIHKCMNWRC